MGHIYIFRNKVNGKVYVGRSDRKEYQRKREHYYELRHNDHGNPYLQASWNKYGEENFERTVIEHTDNPQRTKEREQYWVEYYTDVLGPDNVYNIMAVGDSNYGKKIPVISEKLKQRYAEGFAPRKGKALSDEQREQIRETHSKIWKGFVSPDGNIITITNLAGFCRDNRLYVTGMRNVYYGKQVSCQGWTHINKREDGRKLRYKKE